ncbi:hypothetical protein Y590_18210 [Methylobacterium sp. AMS5]|nr:hypothetical protein Y590_18210 [Methylobacterium sp. AMS5]
MVSPRESGWIASFVSEVGILATMLFLLMT